MFQIEHLFAASHQWFQTAAKEHPQAEWPLLVWNCLPRAGASQFHGHAQVKDLSHVGTKFRANY